MQLAYSSNAYTGQPLDRALDSIAALGFAGAEILCDRPHWFPGEVDDAELQRTQRQLQRLGLGVSNLNANTANGFFNPMPAENGFEPSLSSRNPAWRDWRIAYSRAAIRLAAALGARCISVTSGQPGSGGTPAQGLALFIDSLRQLCDYAAEWRIRVGIEYEPGLLVERASEVAEVIERVDSEWLGVNLDIGHAWLVGEAPAHCVDPLAGRIWNVHVEDIAGQKHYHRVPGDGDLPIGDYIGALQRCGYDGFLTVELYTCSDAPAQAGADSLAYLQPLLQRLAAQG